MLHLSYYRSNVAFQHADRYIEFLAPLLLRMVWVCPLLAQVINSTSSAFRHLVSVCAVLSAWPLVGHAMHMQSFENVPLTVSAAVK